MKQEPFNKRAGAEERLTKFFETVKIMLKGGTWTMLDMSELTNKYHMAFEPVTVLKQLGAIEMRRDQVVHGRPFLYRGTQLLHTLSIPFLIEEVKRFRQVKNQKYAAKKRDLADQEAIRSMVNASTRYPAPGSLAESVKVIGSEKPSVEQVPVPTPRTEEVHRITEPMKITATRQELEQQGIVVVSPPDSNPVFDAVIPQIEAEKGESISQPPAELPEEYYLLEKRGDGYRIITESILTAQQTGPMDPNNPPLMKFANSHAAVQYALNKGTPGSRYVVLKSIDAFALGLTVIR